MSPPIRRCGLKYTYLGLLSFHDPSPPIRRCGLKFLRCKQLNQSHLLLSPPIRRCGLKFSILSLILTTGASPPIRRCGLKFHIDTSDTSHYHVTSQRRCGLKLLHHEIVALLNVVTSHTEVWIEILWQLLFVGSS